MNYYQLKQLSTNNISEIPPITQKDLENPYGIVKLVKKQGEKPYLNYYEKPLPIVSSGMKDVLEAVEPGAVGRPLGLADLENREQRILWLLALTTYKGKYEKDRFMLEKAVLPDKRIFAIKTGLIDHVIIRGDLAESLLRNHYSDVLLEKCTVEVGS